MEIVFFYRVEEEIKKNEKVFRACFAFKFLKLFFSFALRQKMKRKLCSLSSKKRQRETFFSEKDFCFVFVCEIFLGGKSTRAARSLACCDKIR